MLRYFRYFIVYIWALLAINMLKYVAERAYNEFATINDIKLEPWLVPKTFEAVQMWKNQLNLASSTQRFFFLDSLSANEVLAFWCPFITNFFFCSLFWSLNGPWSYVLSVLCLRSTRLELMLRSSGCQEKKKLEDTNIMHSSFNWNKFCRIFFTLVKKYIY